MTKPDGERRTTAAARPRGGGGRQCPSCGARPAVAAPRGHRCSAWPGLQSATRHPCNANEYQPTSGQHQPPSPCWTHSRCTCKCGTKIFVLMLGSIWPDLAFPRQKKTSTPGLPDADTLMVQGRLSNLSHALPAPRRSTVSARKGNAGYRVPPRSPAVGKSQGVGRNEGGTRSDCYHFYF